MNFDEETLIEIEDYIQALDENVGLKVETIQDIAQAISKQRGLVKKLTIPAVVGRSEQLRAFARWYEENYQFEISDRAIQEYERYGS